MILKVGNGYFNAEFLRNVLNALFKAAFYYEAQRKVLFTCEIAKLGRLDITAAFPDIS